MPLALSWSMWDHNWIWPIHKFLGKWKYHQLADALTLSSYFTLPFIHVLYSNFYTSWLPCRFVLYRSLSPFPLVGPIWIYFPEFQAYDPNPGTTHWSLRLWSWPGLLSQTSLPREKALVSWQPWAQDVHPQVVLALTDCYNHWSSAKGRNYTLTQHPCTCSGVPHPSR